MTGKINWSDEQIRAIREERFVGGAKRRELCRRWQMSEGHLDRILAGTARPEAGGPITGGTLLPVVNAQVKTKEQLDAEVKESEQRLDRLLEKQADRAMVPGYELSERALSYGARPRGFVTLSRPVGTEEIPLSDSDIPLPPDWKDFVQKEDETVCKQKDADQLLDELLSMVGLKG